MNKKQVTNKQLETRINILKTIVSLVISYLIAIVIILCVSETPKDAITSFVIGPFTSLRRFGNVIEGMIPIIFTGVGVSIMYSARFFNLAASGSFYMSAVVASYVALQTIPAGIHPVVGILFGGVVAACICVLPALLKVKWGINEVVSALMFNYLATYTGSYILRFVLYDEKAGFMASKVFHSTVTLPTIVSGTRIHLGLIVAIVVVIFATVFMYKTKWGYSIRLTGLSKSFAIASGISTTSAVMASQLVGGFIVGVGGSCEMYGMYTRFQWTDLPTTGFDGVMVSAMCHRNPAMVPLAAFFLAYIRVGADIMARNSDVASEIVYVIQAVIIMMIGADHLLSGLKRKMLVKNSMKSINTEE